MALRRVETGAILTAEELATAAQYSVVIKFSPEDGMYIATVPELSGIASHGATPGEAAEMAHEAAAAWISVNREFGRAIPSPDLFE